MKAHSGWIDAGKMEGTFKRKPERFNLSADTINEPPFVRALLNVKLIKYRETMQEIS